MPVRLLRGAEVARLLPMEACIEVMADALGALARGAAIQPLRMVLRLPKERGAFGVMPAQTDRPDAFGVKVISVYPGNEGTEFDSHQGSVLLFEPQHGTLEAVLDATAITAIRTAAVSGLATRLLARTDAVEIAILGTGVQARTHLEAMRVVRPVRRVRVWSRAMENRDRFAAWAREAFPDLVIEAVVTAELAVRDADVICTVTPSRTPVLHSASVRAGTHVNAVGASLPEARELDTALVRRARLYVDRRESALNEAGDLLIPMTEGAVTADHIVAEIGEVVAGMAGGRETDEEVTVFKSLGLAVEDVAAAHYVARAAEARGIGTVVELGGRRG
jgi:ornithine cyclodeaminase